MTDDEMRNALYDAVYKEFVGPIEQDSEEVLEYVRPKDTYSVGVLYPQGCEFFEIPDEDPSVAESFDEEIESSGFVISSIPKNQEDSEEPIELSNAEYQSAISLTIAVPSTASVIVDVSASRYEKRNKDEQKYFRVPISQRILLDEVPDAAKRVVKMSLPDTSLQVLAVYRYKVEEESSVITVALQNTKRSKDPSSSSTSSCYFQCGLCLSCESGFRPLPKGDQDTESMSDEELSSKLIYSGIKNYAVGHGCAADWSEEKPHPHKVCTSLVPMVEVRPTMYRVDELKNTKFDMFLFSDEARWGKTISSLNELCSCYENWIEGLSERASNFTGWEKRAADSNIKSCRESLARMCRGCEILNKEEIARRAFCMTNEAMLSQYLHYRVVANEAEVIDEPAEGQREWRPFQIAFLLMNIESMTSDNSSEKSILDLIWFPTGGGKTEAYLGLSAFTLLLERLQGETCNGTSIIMRYTLRLLSSQQFARASSLICALEVMRRNNPTLLGEKRFTIGFWVGNAASPNTWDSAIQIYKEMRRGEKPEGSIPIRQCPWCGSQMDEDGKDFKQTRNRDSRRPGEQYLKFICNNESCEFHQKDFDLPLEVVDDEIYYNPPSLLLGTVDKFATVPYRPRSFRIFGIGDNGERIHSPKLIIQDELHLISGPLGSMVASYETLINELCVTRDGSKIVGPKIVASTATVSRAQEQCHELFACGKENVCQFPPSGLSCDDSFFARTAINSPGRRYVGLYAPNLSFASASIRLYTQLLWEPWSWNLPSEEERDPYWTVLGYYGTTRELGQALTWTTSDIPERLFEQYRKNPGIQRRYLNNTIELTGRKDAPEVKKGLDSLTVKYPNPKCVDLCLATNMISVGLDVPRLGIMVVAGQPKETAEYIQATSRIGRGTARGIVFTVYGTTRPRDRSHYESFRNYHESFYQHVEPSSVTAYCKQVRQRAMPGVLFGLYRSTNPSNNNPNSLNDATLDALCEIIEARVRSIDSSEEDATRKQLDDIITEWESEKYSRWDCLKDYPVVKPELPLMHPFGGDTHKEWMGRSFEVPTSMRSVDDECKVSIIGCYSLDEDGENQQ